MQDRMPRIEAKLAEMDRVAARYVCSVIPTHARPDSPQRA